MVLEEMAEYFDDKEREFLFTSENVENYTDQYVTIFGNIDVDEIVRLEQFIKNNEDFVIENDLHYSFYHNGYKANGHVSCGGSSHAIFKARVETTEQLIDWLDDKYQKQVVNDNFGDYYRTVYHSRFSQTATGNEDNFSLNIGSILTEAMHGDMSVQDYIELSKLINR